MRTVRILLIDMPTMLRDIVAGTLEAEPDMTVIGNLSRVGADDLRKSDAQVLIFAAGAGLAGLELVRERRDRVALAISADGRQSMLYELRPCESELGELSSARLVETIRDAVTRMRSGRDE